MNYSFSQTSPFEIRDFPQCRSDKLIWGVAPFPQPVPRLGRDFFLAPESFYSIYSQFAIISSFAPPTRIGPFPPFFVSIFPPPGIKIRCDSSPVFVPDFDNHKYLRALLPPPIAPNRMPSFLLRRRSPLNVASPSPKRIHPPCTPLPSRFGWPPPLRIALVSRPFF